MNKEEKVKQEIEDLSYVIFGPYDGDSFMS